MPPIRRAYPRPLPEIVGAVLARDGALSPAAVSGTDSPPVTAERLAGWRNDPDITAHLAGLVSLDLGQGDLVYENFSSTGLPNEEWFAENNLARLLEYTPGLKTLALSMVPREGRSISLPRYGLNPAHASLPCACSNCRWDEVHVMFACRIK